MSDCVVWYVYVKHAYMCLSVSKYVIGFVSVCTTVFGVWWVKWAF